MVSKIWVVNILLMIFAAFLGLKAYGVWTVDNSVPKIDKSKNIPLKGSKIAGALFDEQPVLPESEYGVVVAKDLFVSERTEPSPVKKTPVEEKQTLTVAQRKEFDQQLEKMTLFGLIITADSAKALVTDIEFKNVFRRHKTTRQLVIKKVKWVKPGDSLGGFKVAEIKNDRIFLTAEKKIYELLLYDKKKSKHRGPSKPKAGPNVVGVTVAPKTVIANEKKATIPSTSKKRTGAEAPVTAVPPATSKRLEKALEKKQAR